MNHEEKLSADELLALVQRVFVPSAEDKELAVLVDLPDAQVPDMPAWQMRRAIAKEWVELLSRQSAKLGMGASLVFYRNARTNNGDLPDHAWIHTGGPLPEAAEALDRKDAIAMTAVLQRFSIVLVPSEFSATAPLKVLAKKIAFRAATMGGFCPAMIPALRLDYGEVNRRVMYLKRQLDAAIGARILFAYPQGEAEVYLDLRFNPAHASSGLLPKTGMAGNLPSGEAYIVPFEGDERQMSKSEGVIPVQFDDEVVCYRVTQNKAVEVISQGPASVSEAAKLRNEPAYGNIAELGLGVLAAFGIRPIGEVLLDEKLGVHIAFGRSDHFGGKVAPEHFTSAEAVVHIDRVYVHEMQPKIQIKLLELEMTEGKRLVLMRDGDYVIDFKS